MYLVSLDPQPLIGGGPMRMSALTGTATGQLSANGGALVATSVICTYAPDSYLNTMFSLSGPIVGLNGKEGSGVEYRGLLGNVQGQAGDWRLTFGPLRKLAARDPSSPPNMPDQDLIPGCMYLGLGYNDFGSFDESGTQGMSRLFDTATAGSGTYLNWALPVNVQADVVGEVEAQSQVFESRSDLSEFFSTKAGVSASYLAFSGSLSASFKSISKSLSEYFFGMSYYSTSGYKAEVSLPTANHLVPEMTQDPDFSTLPQQYSPENRAAFFRFFQKYGTAFVSSVQMGGRIFYNAWIEKSHGMTEEQIQASLKLEYKAVFDANASVDWKQIDLRWAQNRRSEIQAWGGDTSRLKLSAPISGESYAAQYSAWVDSVNANPAPVGFGLTEIHTLFSGVQQDAVKQASRDYRGTTIAVKSSAGYAGIQVAGKPGFASSDKHTGVGYVVVDRASLAILKSAVYPSPVVGGWGTKETYDQLADELSIYSGNQNVIVAMLFWGIYNSSSNFAWAYPSAKLFDVLFGLGAADGLANWGQPTGSSNMGTGSSNQYYQFSYAIVGVPGSRKGDALEDFDSNVLAKVEPAVNLEVFLRPQSDGVAIRYSPT